MFNEYTARSIFDEWNPLRGISTNYVFLLVSLITIGFQIMLIEVGGEFLKTSPLTISQWLITVALGAIGVPVGMLMRLIPVKEDPRSFFDNSTHLTTSAPSKSKALEVALKSPSELA